MNVKPNRMHPVFQPMSASLLTPYLFLIVGFMLGSSPVFGGASGKKDNSSYYASRPLFHMYPDPDALKQTINRFGPVGIELDLLKPGFTMRIAGVEKGSPADGKLRKGQYIESINGKVLEKEDPRIILGNLITEAEATDGKIRMMVKDKADGPAREVVVEIPVLGPYSETWPLNCKKSDTIVRNFAEFVSTHPKGWGSALFLLSTGDEKDLDVVRSWFHGKLKPGGHHFPWQIGYTGPAICEYYLRTGDETVLPYIKDMADYLKRTIYNGSWMGRGGANYAYMSGGHMNAAGVHCLTFLLLAKECGVEVDEHTLQSCLYHFYRYVGHYNVSYGDGFPESGGVDNGKNGGLAFAMAAAASLVPDGEKSLYAKARDINANKSFYTTSWLFHGHTGGGIGEIWRGSAMGLLAKKRPAPYRSFMNERRWMYELARTWDGAFGWSTHWNNTKYFTTGHKGGMSWGNYIPLIYTVPRQKLRIFGAPPTKYSKIYALPKRPWGTAADDVFLSLEAGEYAPGKRFDMETERIATHSASPILNKFRDPGVSDEDILKYALHPDSTTRGSAASAITRHGREHLILPLLKSSDPRGRLAGLRACARLKDEGLTDEMITLAGGMISDPEESWWVVMEALEVLGKAPPEKVAPYTDSIISWLRHRDWWIRYRALQASTPLVTDKRFYKKILPVVGEMIANNTHAVALKPIEGIVKALSKADPEIQEYGRTVLAEAYRNFPKKLHAPGGQDLSSGRDYLIEKIAANISHVPAGFDELYTVSRERFPDAVLPHKKLYMEADAASFGPKVKQALKPVVSEELIPRYMAAQRRSLISEARSEKLHPRHKIAMDGLVDLYKRIGIHDYDWHDFGPGLTEIEWEYHTFDPPEKKIWTHGFRYRKVTYPKGMEDWYKPEFDAAAAGWKKGFAPFGRLGDKLASNENGCNLPFCRCSTPRKTFWDKEVLIMRSRLKLPPLKEGHRYRVCVGGMSHNFSGDGFRIYINGQLLKEQKSGTGKRSGHRFVGGYVYKDFMPVFENSEVTTIAVTSFLSIPGGKRSCGVKRQNLSIFMQEMKVPPLDEEIFARGMEPLKTTAWQQSQDEKDLYLYNGKTVVDKAVLGEWERLAVEVPAIDDFKSAMGKTRFRGRGSNYFRYIAFFADGKTSDPEKFWSGNMLMGLKKGWASGMEVRKFDGKDYLFIETGKPAEKEMKVWKSGWYVFKRKMSE